MIFDIFHASKIRAQTGPSDQALTNAGTVTNSDEYANVAHVIKMLILDFFILFKLRQR